MSICIEMGASDIATISLLVSSIATILRENKSEVKITLLDKIVKKLLHDVRVVRYEGILLMYNHYP